jgi:hypothetical protein
MVGDVSQSDPAREASNLAGRSSCEPVKPRNGGPRESDCGRLGSVELLACGEDRVVISGDWMRSDGELPEVVEDGMSGRNGQRKLGTTRGSPRRSRTAKASRISRRAVKSRCARAWGGWGRLSDDGPGHYNPISNEDPWGSGEPTSWRCTIESAARLCAGQPTRSRGARRVDANRTSRRECREQT